MTEVHAAAYRGDLPALVHWLGEGLDVNATDTVYGYTPVHWLADMAAAGGPRVEMLRVLAAYGASLNARTADGRTPLLPARAAGTAGGDALAADRPG
ncbi:MAG: hypothetical protein K2X82_13060, partial [Gemmataceae bacterium]|nr:hypothetical protein [Gemmataceae bacterium]